jgi:CDP-glucose 4,6-dehydratase
VRGVIDALAANWRDPGINYVPSHLPEAGLLALDSNKARSALSWSPPWNLDETLRRTAEWYRAFYEQPESIVDVTRAQLSNYRAGLVA